MNPFSVVTGGRAGRPAPLRLAPGLNESDAIVDLFLARERGSESGKAAGMTAAARAVASAASKSVASKPAGPAHQTAARGQAKSNPMLRFLDGPVEVERTDALDLLIGEPDVYDRARAARPSPALADSGRASGADAARPVAGSADDRPAVLAACMAGLRSIYVHCPYAPGVELAVDGDGALHLIAWRGPGDAGTAAIGELMIASKWAWEHMSLLAKVAPLDERMRPAVQHLVTARPEGLRGLLTTSLRVHLAIAVEDESGRRWVCAALNEA